MTKGQLVYHITLYKPKLAKKKYMNTDELHIVVCDCIVQVPSRDNVHVSVLVHALIAYIAYCLMIIHILHRNLLHYKGATNCCCNKGKKVLVLA
jgi:hypothetical protein